MSISNPYSFPLITLISWKGIDPTTSFDSFSSPVAYAEVPVHTGVRSTLQLREKYYQDCALATQHFHIWAGELTKLDILKSFETQICHLWFDYLSEVILKEAHRFCFPHYTMYMLWKSPHSLYFIMIVLSNCPKKIRYSKQQDDVIRFRMVICIPTSHTTRQKPDEKQSLVRGAYGWGALLYVHIAHRNTANLNLLWAKTGILCLRMVSYSSSSLLYQPCPWRCQSPWVWRSPLLCRPGNSLAWCRDDRNYTTHTHSQRGKTKEIADVNPRIINGSV